MEQVKTAHIKLFLAMMDDRQRKPRYINDLLKAFKTFFNYCPEFALNALGGQAEEISRLVAQVMAERQEGQN